jgi:Tfp pilus assembly protein PilV
VQTSFQGRIPRNAPRCSPAGGSRRGVTLLETVVAATVLSAVVLTFAPLMARMSASQRSVSERQLALEEVSNLLERISARGWSGVTDQWLSTLSVSEACSRHLRDQRLDVELVESADGPAAKRVAVELVWKNRTDAPPAAVRLTTWIYQTEGQ